MTSDAVSYTHLDVYKRQVLGEVIVNPTFLFRMDVRDLTFGNHEGAGINFAEFSITGDGVDLSLIHI